MRTAISIAGLRRPVIAAATVLAAMAVGMGTANAAVTPNTAPAGGPVTKGSGSAHLVASQSPQQRNYWCGPAALVSTLHEGAHGSYSQTWAAGVLGTTTDGTNDGNMLSALNKYSQGFPYVYVALPDRPSADQLATYKRDLQGDIGVGEGLVGNVVEVAGGPHLPGHPTNETIYHYIAIDGYSGSGATTHYADPASSVWSSVPKYSNISSSTMVILLGERGYFW